MITTLVLGAGVSQDYHYPSGVELVNAIMNKLANESDSTSRELMERIKKYDPDSIDDFARILEGEKTEHVKFLKALIAEILFEREIPELKIERDKDFYQYLCKTVTPDLYSNFRIISFNYDRALEFYFHKYLSAFYYSDDEISSTLAKLQIVHVHGRLPALPWENQNLSLTKQDSYEYGYGRGGNYGVSRPQRPAISFLNDYSFNDARARHLRETQEANLLSTIELRRNHIKQFGKISFRFVHEGKPHEDAKAAIDEANRIVFLGFGYHPSNMEFLGLDKKETTLNKKVIGTTYGVRKNYLRELQSKYPSFRLVDCTAMNLLHDHVCLPKPEFDEA
jgi:hypothetical protein